MGEKLNTCLPDLEQDMNVLFSISIEDRTGSPSLSN